MKALKRLLNLTKEEIEYNIQIISYHKKYLKAVGDMMAINRDTSTTRAYKRDATQLVRDYINAEWRIINERINNSN